ncbi:hypothetical protein BS78_02G016200 [Paspalum vaginatum]|nr:hypothetical protein BS78_02G016200 [Paspalum vaginatum]
MQRIAVHVIQSKETVSQVISNLLQKYEEKEEFNANRNLERLEMALVRLEAALDPSDKWQITDESLLRWRRKLKRAAQECDGTLHKCKQRILEDKQVEHEVQNSSFPNRIIHATKSFASSIFNRNDNGLSKPIVQRFEWYADGASEFLRFIELGGTPHRHMPFNSITRNLLSVKELYHKIFRGNEYPLLQLWLSPHHTAEHRTEAALVFIRRDGTAPEGNIHFSMMVQLSESTDMVGIAAKSLRLFAPYVKYFSWVPPVYSYQKEHLYNLHSLGSQWYRPNPLCCKQRGRPEAQCYSNNQDMAGSSAASMEPLVGFNLQWQVSLPVHSKKKETISLQDSPYLKAGIMFGPHGSSEDTLPVNNSSVAVAIVGGEQHLLHTDITLEQLGDIMIPKATDYFCQNAEVTVYQMIWRSKHGSARIQVEKPIMGTRRTFGELRNRTHTISHMMDIWATHMPVRMERSSANWMQKDNEIHG